MCECAVLLFCGVRVVGTGAGSERDTNKVVREIVRERSAIELFEEANERVPPQRFRHRLWCLSHGSGIKASKQATDRTLEREDENGGMNPARGKKGLAV
jgi:hypothetical protein